ncbi:DegT/DnrJ/EryC1/StrS family aminotransferase [Nitrosopumilus sp.]|uniref:DegT/DnrJ/EryC1/StrS family aminotransferase n=1 Tax=Nitrosopumilus sp. TaxID=2024843 RepID=UPI00247D1AE7|nr:DegT/DnrJ/EryC1/StrS family aminotransferase [Nitrosopumilus sp.]MCV0430378.1 DegT/DnrJ/EryC1/StrS family aminotransferase [Nitrosopumilus sp.]
MKVPYFLPWINDEDKKAVLRSLDQRWLTNGPFLKKFEKGICDFLGTKYAQGVGSATQALHLSLRAANIKAGDEVIVPTFTFVATANAVKYCNAKPVLVDVDPLTFNILPSEIEKKINKKTCAVIVVHYGGQSCDMDEILKIAKKNNLIVIEDCAHAFGSTYKKVSCGNIGKTGCFSFYPTKIITTGEGGAISTNDKNFLRRIRILRSQGMDISSAEREENLEWKYDIIDLGYNYRMDEIRASLGLSQLKRIKEINKKREKIATIYDQKLKNIPGLITPYKKPNRNHIYHLYTIRITKDYHISRNELFKKLNKKGIGASVQYIPIHKMTLYKKEYENNSKDFPNADLLKDQVLSLPIFPTMTTKQIERVITVLRKN